MAKKQPTPQEPPKDRPSEERTCECGRPGRHPYPIGGGWAWACDDCKAASLLSTDGDDVFGRRLTESDWSGWASDPPALRPDHIATAMPAGETPLGEDAE